MKNGKHNQLQVFYDYGDGFSEENSIKISYEGLSFSTFVAIPEKAIAIRIDPTENMFCVVTDFKAETEYGECSIQVKDAEKIGNVYSFYTKDPQFIIDRHNIKFEIIDKWSSVKL